MQPESDRWSAGLTLHDLGRLPVVAGAVAALVTFAVSPVDTASAAGAAQTAAIAAGAAGAAAPSSATPAAPPAVVTVELRGGRVIRGALRLIQPRRYLVQGEEDLYEVSGDEITAVDGRPGPPPMRTPNPPLIEYQTYELVAPGGDVELWTQLHFKNESQTVVTYVQWGAKQQEIELYRAMVVYDSYGRQAAVRIEPRAGTELYDVFVDLAVPVVPGETVTLSQRLRYPGRARQRDGVFSLTFNGDFPEDRLYLRKVQLPAGARIERVEPPPALRFEHQRAPVIVWRRYFPAHARVPLTVTYRLAAAGTTHDR